MDPHARPQSAVYGRLVDFDPIRRDHGRMSTYYNATGDTITGYTATEVQNPISRSICRLDPPLPIANLDAFHEAFSRFCDDAWTLPTRRDPSRVDPQRVIDGTEPLDVMDDHARRLVWEHGPYAAQDAVMRASDAYWKAQGFPAPPQGTFGPLSPIPPVPVDVDPGAGRPEPRRWEYPVGCVPGDSGTSLPVDDGAPPQE